MNKYLDDNGLLYLWSKIKALVSSEQIQSDWNQSSSSSKDYIKNKPTLGTASSKDVADSGNASSTEVVMGNDTRLTDSRNAADVYDWAKASTKPAYTASEVGAVSTAASQGLDSTQQANARANIGAGTSSFSGSYNDLSNKPTIPTTASEVGAIASTDKGAVNGVATLDSSGKVPASQLPSYVDDVIEVYGISGTTALTSGWLSTTSNGSAITPETGKIYVLMADFPSTNPVYGTNSQFRWSGSSYVQIYDGGTSAITNAEIDTIVAS